MNLPMRSGMNEEVTNQGIDNDEEHGDASGDSDEEHSDASSEDISIPVLSAFRVRREAIAQWLNWLAEFVSVGAIIVCGCGITHFLFGLYSVSTVVVDTARLQQLPVDGDVGDQLPTIEADAVHAEQEIRDAAATDNDSSDADELCISWTRSRSRFSKDPKRPQLSRSHYGREQSSSENSNPISTRSLHRRRVILTYASGMEN
ncbi:hypothetical protein E4U13_007975 [Claviceps humidiphila]|uniref:Uncharacterized protein n=1 Tax=Claviceps humidiphila TaxID=1294629 RepID=A0A9P7Q5Y1_9HYPO|nr:hypothetical protein E4U13_007975 [Claviceps humidiphila]